MDYKQFINIFSSNNTKSSIVIKAKYTNTSKMNNVCTSHKKTMYTF